MKNIYKDEFRYYIPEFINKSIEWENKNINLLLEKAIYNLGKLEIYSTFNTNFNHLLTLKEAIYSNKIVELDSTVANFFLKTKKEEYINTENYINSLNWGIKELQNYPLSVRLIKNCHKILYKNTNAENIKAGKIREIDTHYFRPKNLKTTYKPPKQEHLKEFIKDARKFWNNSNLKIPNIIKLAISLYQFEILLPFVNGNGRTSRILFYLELKALNILNTPILCLSRYFYKNKLNYYKLINEVRIKKNIEEWILFVLNGIIESSEHIELTIEKLNSIKNKYSELIENNIGLKQTSNALKLLNLIIKSPYLSVNQIAQNLNIKFQTANVITNKFLELNILQEYNQNKRNRIFYCKELIEDLN